MLVVKEAFFNVPTGYVAQVPGLVIKNYINLVQQASRCKFQKLTRKSRILFNNSLAGTKLFLRMFQGEERLPSGPYQEPVGDHFSLCF